MFKKISFLFVIIVFILVCGVIWHQKNEPPDFQWIRGTNIYRFKINSRTNYLFSDSDASTNFAVEGDLSFTVLDLDESYSEVLFNIDNVRAFIDYESNKGTAEIYKSEFVSRLDTSGRFISFSFPGNYPEEKINMLKGLLLHFEVICSGEKKFETKQKDSTGTYIAQYDYFDKNHILKKKTGYENVMISDGLNTKGVDAEVKNSKSVFSIDKKNFWIKSFQGKETILLSLSKDRKLAEIKTDASLFYIGSDKKKVHEEKDYDYYSAIYKSLEKTKPESENKNNAKNKNPGLTKNQKFKIMKDLLSVITNQSPISDSNKFKDFLRENPDMIKEIPEFLKKSEMEDKHAYLIGVLGIIGSPEAQNALCSVFTDFSQSYKNRDRAVVALGSLNVFPEPETIIAVEQMLASIRPETDNNDIAGASLFSLGIISSNLREKNIEKADEINSLLEFYLENASNDLQKYYLLGAIGNTGSKKAASEVIPFLNSSDKNLRRSAAEALYEPDSEDISRSLIEAMEKEGDPFVKSRLIESLSQKNLSEEKADSIARKSLEETDADIRRNYIYFIENNRQKIKNLDGLIDSLLETETSKNNIKALLKIERN